MNNTTITGGLLYNLVKCPCKVFLECYGDENEKTEKNEFLLKKMKDGIIHESEVVKELGLTPLPENLSNEDAFKITLELMEKGANIIGQGVLIHGDCVGRPDMLIRTHDESGDYYIPVDIKSGKYLKKEYVMQVMFYCDLLGKIQGVYPSNAGIINKNKEELKFSTADYKEEYSAAISFARRILNREEEVSPVFSNSNCSMCEWKNHCFNKLKAEEDLSLLYRLNSNVREELRKNNINNFTDLLNSDNNFLKSIKGIGSKSAENWKLMVQSLKNNEMILKKKIKFPEKKLEIFFDIEGDTELGIDYLYGCLVRENGREEFIPFWADTPENEKEMWEEFCSYISKLDNFVIYHYAPYEKTSIKRLKEKYGCDEELYSKIMNNLVDLYKIVLDSAILLVYSYSIKRVAKWIGFNWRSGNAGGAQSLCWYSEYLNGAEEYKKILLEYNEDDVTATRVVKDWLDSINCHE